MGEGNALQEISALAQTLRPNELEQGGKELAKNLHGYAPVIYASEQNESIADNWKIKFNETGKIPAFYYVVRIYWFYIEYCRRNPDCLHGNYGSSSFLERT